MKLIQSVYGSKECTGEWKNTSVNTWRKVNYSLLYSY